jgi:hypothetical protein
VSDGAWLVAIASDGSITRPTSDVSRNDQHSKQDSWTKGLDIDEEDSVGQEIRGLGQMK